MYTDKTEKKSQTRKDLFLSWEFILINVLLFGLIAVFLEQPVGSMEGVIALEQKDFGLYSYDLKKNRVNAVVTGPRYGKSITRGVWLSEDGHFRLDQLPVGEYSLRVSAPGFETSYKSSVFVESGKLNKIEPLKLQVLQPNVQLASNMRVFTTKEKPRFYVNARGATETTIKVYSQSFLESARSKMTEKAGVYMSSDMTFYASYNKKFQNPFKNIEPLRVIKRTLRPTYTDSARANFELDEHLPPGDYFVVATVEGILGKKKSHDLWWFTVSDIGLVVKQSPDRTLVRAINLETLKPEEGVEVSVLNGVGDTGKLASGTTNSTGNLELRDYLVSGDSSVNTIFVGNKGGHHAYGGTYYWMGRRDNYLTYFYTDRPVYRLGQTVAYKAIIRSRDKNGVNNPGARVPVSITIEDPMNSAIKSVNLVSNEHGTINGTVDVPADGKTGFYQVQMRFADGSTSYESFEVTQYRKPEYTVELKPESPRVTAGGKVKAVLSANYFFGGPVANARVKYSVYINPDWNSRYRLMPRPEYYSFFDDWTEDQYSFSYEFDGSLVHEGTAVTDENGQAVIEFDTKAIKADSSKSSYYWDYMDMRYKIDAEVTDISRLTCVGSGEVSVTAGDFALYVQPDSYVIGAGDAINTKVEAIGYDGKPIANAQIDLKVSRWPYNSLTKTSSEKVLANTKLTTNSNGVVETSIKVKDQWPTDSFYITASAKDSHGNTIVSGESVWVSNDRYAYELDNESAKKEPFKVSLDKRIYKPGDVAKVMISGPFTGKEQFEALVSVEGASLYDYKIVPLKSSANLVEIPVKESYMPDGYIGVTMIAKKKQFYSTTKMFMISPHDHFLNIAVKANKEKFRPGDKVTYDIEAKNADGTPANGVELSMGVVDESIYAIRPDATQDIRKFFFSKRGNKVSTFCTFPEQYSGGPDKAVLGSSPIRKNFKDTAAWFPTLVTDSNGKATAAVTLPDNLTTWRATVRGISMNCDVGAATNKILVTKDIIARLALPRFLTEGDKTSITAVVHNYSDKKQTIKLQLVLSEQFKTGKALSTSLTVDKDKAESFSWPVTMIDSGDGSVTVSATGQTDGDALERHLPVRSLGIPMYALQSGVLTDAAPSVTLSTSAAADSQSPSLAVSLARSTIGQIQGSYDSLIDYPYGCTEQTMSRLIPSIVAMDLHKQLGVPLSAESLKRFAKVKDMAFTKLEQHHHSDGGWGWWQNDQSDAYMTCHVLEGLKLLKESGTSVEDGYMVKSGLKWLQSASDTLLKQLKDPKLIEDYTARTRRCEMARLIYTQLLYGEKPNKEAVTWLKSRTGSFAPEPLAYTVLALKRAGDNSGAQEAYNRLMELSNKTADTVDWEHTSAMMKKLKLLKVSDYTFSFTGEETTALALTAILEMEPGNSALIEKTKQWLMLHRGKDGWANTKTTAQVLLALLKEANLTKAEATNLPVKALALAQSALKAELSFAPNERWTKEKDLRVPITAAADGKPAPIELEKQGEGKLYYRSRLDFVKRMKPGEKPPVPGLPGGLSVTRQFFRMEKKAQTSDGVIHLKAVPIANGSITPGETILMKIEVNSPMSLPYVMVESPLPSGAEVVDNQSRLNSVDSDEESTPGITGDWGAAWWSHQDVLDDKIVFFGAHVPQGKSVFHTLLRMELPGEVQMNPIRLEGMYTDKIRCYSQSNLLNIKE